MIDKDQLRDLIIIPTLHYLEPEIPFSQSAVELLKMTAAHESRLGTYIAQVNGPALGIYQMEPATEEDIQVNYLRHRDYLDEKILQTGQYLTSDLRYATAMARVHYYRDPEPLPEVGDVSGLANYAKRVWNTEAGKATEDDYFQAYKKLCLWNH